MHRGSAPLGFAWPCRLNTNHRRPTLRMLPVPNPSPPLPVSPPPVSRGRTSAYHRYNSPVPWPLKPTRQPTRCSAAATPRTSCRSQTCGRRGRGRARQTAAGAPPARAPPRGAPPPCRCCPRCPAGGTGGRCSHSRPTRTPPRGRRRCTGSLPRVPPSHSHGGGTSATGCRLSRSARVRGATVHIRGGIT